MEELKTKVFTKYKDNDEKLKEFKKLYKIYTQKEETMLEYEKINKQYEDIRQQLLLIANKSKEANCSWDQIKEQINVFQ